MIRWMAPLALHGARWAVTRLWCGRRREPSGRHYAELAGWAAAGVMLGLSASVLSEQRRSTRMTGRVALVTGGSRGLGLQLAREFGASGASVVVCARNQEKLDRAVAELNGRGVRAHGIQCDLADPDQARAMVEEAAERFGRLDVVVNNAGMLRVGPQETVATEHVEDAMAVMFWAPFHVARAAEEPLRATGGTLVNITSVGAYLAAPHLLPYSCAKAAWRALSEGLDAESADSGIHVTTVVPGLMRTGSPRGVVFAGAPEREYAWFALIAGLPLVSVNAERAARRIVHAVGRGRGYVVLTPLARIGMAAHGLAPGTTQAALRLTGRFLPSAPYRAEERLGQEAGRGPAGRLVNAVAGLNERAARHLNQVPRVARR